VIKHKGLGRKKNACKELDKLASIFLFLFRELPFLSLSFSCSLSFDQLIYIEVRKKEEEKKRNGE